MKVFTSPEFVKAVEQLPETEQRDTYRLFETVSQFSEKELLQSPFVQPLIDMDEKRIFAIHSQNTRLIYSIEKIEDVDTAIFIQLENWGMPISSFALKREQQVPLSLTLSLSFFVAVITYGVLEILASIVSPKLVLSATTVPEALKLVMFVLLLVAILFSLHMSIKLDTAIQRLSVTFKVISDILLKNIIQSDIKTDKTIDKDSSKR